MEEELVDNDELEAKAKVPNDIDQKKPNEWGENVQPATSLDKKSLPLTDGQNPIPIDSSGVESGLYSAPSPIGEESIQFESGNWSSIGSLSTPIDEKVSTLTRQVAPLVEVALIELLGRSDSYKRTAANASLIWQESSFGINFSLQYSIPMWIGTEVPEQDVLQDAQYVYNKLKLIEGLRINTCSIDTNDGSLKVVGIV